MTRYALRMTGEIDLPEVIALAAKMQRYMPSNYEAIPVVTNDARHAVLIKGEDSHGWTLDGYVLPRLASGLYAAREVDEDEGTNVLEIWRG